MTSCALLSVDVGARSGVPARHDPFPLERTVDLIRKPAMFVVASPGLGHLLPRRLPIAMRISPTFTAPPAATPSATSPCRLYFRYLMGATR